MNVTHAVSEQDTAHFLVDAAAWAPSVHNTQPWWFGTRGSTVTLHADPERRLNVADPDGREMLMSCGAALCTLRLAARRLGHSPQVRMASDPDRPGLIADVTLGPARPAGEEENRMYDQIRRRRTHRGGFRPEGLPAGLLQALRTCALDENAALRVVADPRARIALGALTEVAEQLLRQNPDYCAEMARWAPRPGSRRRDGVHEDAYPHDPGRTDPPFAQRDFARGHGWGLPAGERHGAAGVVALLTTRTDERGAWLEAGQALQHVLLRAAQDGVSAAFHTQALEIPELRELIRARFCDGAHPQTIMRLGVAEREGRSVRRPPEELIRPEP
ncbi:Acg family FMN-binding oxidoreductase [Actinoallomurus sp. CA-142502]|uniref:Acg family FMN-binding oxidoreductase n=1 Tax=Actinoallomurus sp. CA-142502 TaxID=3239885 RepID=UPI003D8C2633